MLPRAEGEETCVRASEGRVLRSPGKISVSLSTLLLLPHNLDEKGSSSAARGTPAEEKRRRGKGLSMEKGEEEEEEEELLDLLAQKSHIKPGGKEGEEEKGNEPSGQKRFFSSFPT